MLVSCRHPSPKAREKEQARSREAPPKLADLKVGHDTVEDAERRYGPGLVVTGAHAQGARLWRSRETGWYLYVDAFYYSKAGALIDQITVITTATSDWRKAGIPWASLGAKQSSLFGSIRLGMSKAQILSVVKSEGIAARSVGNAIKWSEKCVVEVDESTPYDTLTVELDFDKEKRLDAIAVGLE